MESDPRVSADLAHKLPDDVSLLARDGVVLTLGPGMIEVFGASGACGVGARLSDLVAEPDRGIAEAALKVLFAGEESQNDITVRRRAETGFGVPVRLSLVAIRDRGDTVAVALELVDGPALANPEAARRATDCAGQRFDVAMGPDAVGPWFLDLATGRFTRFAAFGALIGWPAGDPPPDFDQFMALIHAEDRPLAARELEAVARGAKPETRVDFRIRHAAGHWLWCMTIASLWRDEDDPAPVICAVTIDNSEARANEQRFRLAVQDAHAARSAASEATAILHHATEHSNVVPWHCLPDVGGVQIGAHLSTLLGYAKGYTIDAKVLAAITHPDDVARATADIAAVSSGRIDSFSHDLRLRRADESWSWFTARGKRADKTNDGCPSLVCGSFTAIDSLDDDEHHLTAASEEIRRAHDRLNALADTFPGALFEFSATPNGTGHFRYASARFAEIMGVDRTRFEQDANAIFNAIRPKDLNRIRATARAAVRDGKAFRTEVQRVHPSGAPRWLMVSASAAAEDDGSVTWYGTLLDITEQKSIAARAADAAAAVRAEQARLNTLAKNAPCALYEYRVGANGFAGFDYCSSGFLEIFGISAEALEKDPAAFRRYVPADDLHRVQAVIAEGARSLEPITFTHRIDHPERGLRWVMVAGTPVKRPDGSVTIYSSILDVTEGTRAERRAAEAAEELRETNERFVRLAENAPGALFEHRRHPDGSEEFHFLSSTLLDIMGVDLAHVQADAANMFARVPWEDREKLRDAMARSVETREHVELTHRVMHPEKGVRWVLVAVETVRQRDGDLTGYGSVVDITERRETEQRASRAVEDLAHAHERLTYLTDGATVGLFETRLHPDGRMEFPFTSARFENLMGFSRAEIEALGDGILARIDPEDLARVQAAIRRSHSELRPIQVRFRLRHPERGPLWLEFSAGAPKAEGGGFTWVAALHDVTSDVKRERDLRQAHRVAEQMRARNEQQALHDGLTGLPNRRYFDDVIAERKTQAQRGGPGDCTLVRLDLDRFKHVNDTLGHAAGDKVLVRVADVLRDCVRVGDIAARNGGDEFSILMAIGTTELEAREVVARVQSKLAEPLVHDSRQCRFGVSFGIAHTGNILETGDDIHLFADAALHRAKVEGGNRTEAFTPQLHFEIHRDRSLAIAIHEALENDELVPYFQPQIKAADGSLFGAEVLLRWNHPTEGIIAPGAFMHVAEQLRLVPDIDRAMMEASCDVLSRWRAQGLVVPKISFNVSSGRMHDPDILAFAAKFAKIDTKVTFELLESILVEEENQTFRDNLKIIRDAGVDIEIDDFGSGHASIIGLMEIEPTALKIDQRIVFPVVRDPRARDLVHAIVEIARALGMNTVAEGVETEAHADILREIGCGVLQGYHYAKPLSEAQFLNYALARHNLAG